MPFIDTKTNEYYGTFAQAYTAFSEKMGLPASPDGEPYYPTTVGEVEKAIDYMGLTYVAFSPLRLVDILEMDEVVVRSILTGTEFRYSVNLEKMRLEADEKYIPLDNFYEQECLAVFPIEN